MFKYYFFLLLILGTWSLQAQCPTGNVLLLTQAEVDDFVATYPDCTTIAGNLMIGSFNSDISDVSGLSSLTTVDGDLDFTENDFTSLDGFSNLNTVGGALRLGANNQLTDLSELSNLTTLGGDLRIQSNFSLLSLNGLDNLSSIGGSLEIQFNTSLASLTGLANVITVEGGRLIVGNNDALMDLDGLSSLTTINGELTISTNNSLTNLDGLSNLTAINGILFINFNPLLTSINGIANIDASTITNLVFAGHPLISNCTIQSICDYLGVDMNMANIDQNGLGCNSAAEVAILCSCPTGDLTLSTQEEVDAFVAAYPDCSGVLGNMLIGSTSGDSDISDISELINFTTVSGDLTIQSNVSLSSLSGLDNLNTVGGSLSFWFNPALVSLSGLDNVTTVGENLTIYGNNAMTDLSGLGGITSLEGNVEISDNLNLTSLNGLNTLDFVGGFLRVQSNNALENFNGVNNLFTINGDLQILNNPSLVSLSALNVFNLSGDFEMRNLPLVNTLAGAFSNLSLDGDLIIGNLPAITSLNGLESFGGPGGSLTLFGNSGLTSLNGLESIFSLGGDLTIESHLTLASLDGLENLEDIEGAIVLNGNFTLSDLNGIRNIAPSTIELLFIMDNITLSDCAITNFCDYLGIPSNNVNISGNAVGCNTREEIEEACSPICPEGNVTLTTQAEVDAFVVSYPDCTEIMGNLQIGPNTESADIVDLSGLSGLIAVNGFLAIENNSALTSLVGLGNIDALTITNLIIQSNGQLTNCAIANVCTYLAEEMNEADISGNAEGCENQEAVEMVCMPSSNVNLSQTKIELTPNPTTGRLQLRNINAEQIDVFTSQGQRVARYNSPGQELDLSTLPTGVYHLLLQTAGNVYAARVVKM